MGGIGVDVQKKGVAVAVGVRVAVAAGVFVANSVGVLVGV